MDKRMVEAVAEAWASIDGKLEKFRWERDNPHAPETRIGGYYNGYMHEAEELLKRVEARGYQLVGIEAPKP